MEPRVFAPLPPTTTGTGRFPGRTLLATILLMAGGTLLWAQVADNSADKSADTGAEKRIREGSEIVDLDGHFRVSGDRVSFFSADGKRRLVGLENLNLQRIARTIADDPRQLRWKVSGTVTEYRGANFLLIRQAILAADPALGRGPLQPGGGVPVSAPSP